MGGREEGRKGDRERTIHIKKTEIDIDINVLFCIESTTFIDNKWKNKHTKNKSTKAPISFLM